MPDQPKDAQEETPYDRFEKLARQVFSVPLSAVRPKQSTDDNETTNEQQQPKRKRRKK
jgi:hypothetical protein